MVIMFLVGIVFISDWFVRVIGGFCIVLNVGIIVVGVFFSVCVIWVVVVDRNFEKFGDKYLVENILSEIFYVRKFFVFLWNLKFFNMVDKSVL